MIEQVREPALDGVEADLGLDQVVAGIGPHDRADRVGAAASETADEHGVGEVGGA